MEDSSDVYKAVGIVINMKLRRDIVEITVRTGLQDNQKIIDEKYYTVITLEENVGPLKTVYSQCDVSDA